MRNAVGTRTTVRAALALTGSFVATTEIDLQNFDSCDVEVVSVGNDSGKLCQFKYEWSVDGTNYFPEKQVEVATGASGLKINTAFDKVFSCSLTTAGNIWNDRATNQGRFFRLSVREATGVSTATVAIYLTPKNLN